MRSFDVRSGNVRESVTAKCEYSAAKIALATNSNKNLSKLIQVTCNKFTVFLDTKSVLDDLFGREP